MNEGRQLQASALRRCMEERGWTAAALAEKLGLDSRDAITSWRMGRSWPKPPAEKELQRVLSLPGDFFAKIAAGVPYSDALVVIVTQSESVRPVVLQQVEQILAADPDTPVGVLSMFQVQEQLRKMVELLIGLTGELAAHDPFTAPEKKE